MNITKENLQEVVKQIQNLRETKGKEQEALELIEQALKVATESKDWGTVTTLHWEASLVHQHLVMKDSTNKGALEKMEEHAELAFHNDCDFDNSRKKGVTLRFLGRVADYKGDYVTAIEHYNKALALLSETSDSNLEIRAFIAYSTVASGNVEEGMELSKEVYSEFFDSELGKKLKEKDYFVWAVWMSGIAPRQLKALKMIEADFDVERMRTWLNESLTELESPTGNVTWGDDKFAIRVTELKEALDSLS